MAPSQHPTTFLFIFLFQKQFFSAFFCVCFFLHFACVISFYCQLVNSCLLQIIFFSRCFSLLFIFHLRQFLISFFIFVQFLFLLLLLFSFVRLFLFFSFFFFCRCFCFCFIPSINYNSFRFNSNFFLRVFFILIITVLHNLFLLLLISFFPF